MPNKIRNFALISVFCIALVAIPIYALLQRIAINQKQQVQNLQSTNSGKPTMPVTDLAPQLSSANKTTLTIKHADSTFEKIIMPKTMVNQFIHNLAKGDILVSQQ